MSAVWYAAFPMISWTRSRRMADQSHHLPRIPLSDEIGALSPARGSKLNWLIGEGIQGARRKARVRIEIDSQSAIKDG